jgi:hypothetical protein
VPTHYVLDQNFPYYVAGFDWPPSISVSRLTDVDPGLTRNREDWQVILALAEREDVDGFVTNDRRMLLLPKEMIALSRTRLALVVTDGVGHQPLRATGLIMLHLEHVTRSLDGQPRVFLVRPAQLQPVSAWTQVNSVAKHLGVHVNQLVGDELAAMGLPKRPSDER